MQSLLKSYSTNETHCKPSNCHHINDQNYQNTLTSKGTKTTDENITLTINAMHSTTITFLPGCIGNTPMQRNLMDKITIVVTSYRHAFECCLNNITDMFE